MGTPSQPDHLRASPDVFAGQKRKADAPLESDSLQKLRTEGPAIPANGHVRSSPHNLGEQHLRRVSGGSDVPWIPTSKSPSPAEPRKRVGPPNGVSVQPAKRRFLEVPIWATRTSLGKRRIIQRSDESNLSHVRINGHTTNSLTPETKPPPPPQAHPTHNTPETKHESNVTGIPPFNGLVRVVSDFLWQNVIAQEPFDGSGPAKASWEIEAKLGTLIDRNTQSRYENGSLSETVLSPNVPGIRFESNLTQNHFKILNAFLNDEVKRSRAQGRVPIEYNHPHELDAFYQLNQAGYEQLPPAAREYINPSHRSKLRVTTDLKTGEIKDKIVKTRVNDLHIYCPNNTFDIRISVSLEIKWEGPIESFAEMRGENDNRDKNRLSYTHQATHIEITQVKGQTGLTHEAEIELDSSRLRQEAEKIQNNGGAAKYEELVNMLVENAIVLNRAAVGGMPPGVI